MQGSLFKDERKLDESFIVRDLARQVCRQITRRTITKLIRMTNYCLSGDDSELKNTWDEICVQVQDDQSFFWDEYVQTVSNTVAGEVMSLKPHELDAVYLQTPESWEWCDEDPATREPYPVCSEDVVRHIVDNYVLPEAEKWSNPRIRAFLERVSYSD